VAGGVLPDPDADRLRLAFKPSDGVRRHRAGWTLDTLRGWRNPNYPAIIWRTLWLSVLTTVICLAAGHALGYYMARAPAAGGGCWLLLTVVPFWTSFLVRVFAWKHAAASRRPLKRAAAGPGPGDRPRTRCCSTTGRCCW
jgi:ABC-type spermidine/putrescine transport system permease subunit I